MSGRVLTYPYYVCHVIPSKYVQPNFMSPDFVDHATAKAATDVSVPVLVSYLDDSETKAAVTGELLSIASHSAVAFKSTIANLNSTQRANLEAAFRQSAGPSKQRVQDSNTQPTAAPSINLKSFAL